MLLIVLLSIGVNAYVSEKTDLTSINLTVVNLYGVDRNSPGRRIIPYWTYLRNNSQVQANTKAELSISCTAPFPIIWNITGYIVRL